MYAFFLSLYVSLFEGEWLQVNASQARTYLNDTIKTLLNLVLNALGGHFTEMQSLVYNGAINPHTMVMCILALITFLGICAVVWKLTKAVFSIFFSRA